MRQRPSLTYLSFISLMLVSLLLLVSRSDHERMTARHETMRRLVREFGLTDLALFPEARYTRHLSLSDTHAPFQDHPTALEHFPAGTVTPPPFSR